VIEQNQAHPDYDHDMELLCSLPLWPEGARLHDLRVDLFQCPYPRRGRWSCGEVRRAIERLRARYEIRCGRRLGKTRAEGRGDEAGIDPRSWGQAQADGRAYRARVYGDGGLSAAGWAKIVEAWEDERPEPNKENTHAPGRA
jgi:hypothetical protein